MDLPHTMVLDGEVWIMCPRHGRWEKEAERTEEMAPRCLHWETGECEGEVRMGICDYHSKVLFEFMFR
jgi:hypothetical protein